MEIYSRNNVFAKEFLGINYITPKEMSEVNNFKYTDEQLRDFDKSFPDSSKLKTYSRYGVILIPGPPKDMNFLDILGQDRNYFSKQTKQDWYHIAREKSLREDMIRAGQWLAISTPRAYGPMYNDSLYKLEEMYKNNDGYLPNVAEASYFLVNYFKVRGALIGDYGVATSSILSEELMSILQNKKVLYPQRTFKFLAEYRAVLALFSLFTLKGTDVKKINMNRCDLSLSYVFTEKGTRSDEMYTCWHN